jgi:DNA-binding transcriptional LysR family regulator
MNTGTTVAAAQLLNMSQPAVSNAIKQLEQTLVVPLFSRVNGRLRPTEEAELLYRKSLDVFAAFDAARAVAGQLREKTVGQLRIATTPSPGSSVMPLAVRNFREQRSNVRISVMVGSVEKVQDMVAKEEANIGLYYITTDHPLLVAEPLASFEMLCALPVSHRLAEAESVGASELQSETLISYCANERLATVVESAFRADGCEYAPGVEVRFVHSACELVAQGIGVAVVDAFAALRAELYESVVFRPFRPRTTLPVYFCERHDRVRSVLASLFLDELRRILNVRQGVFRMRDSAPG